MQKFLSMGPAFHIKVLGPGSHIYSPRSQVKDPRWKVLGPGYRIAPMGPGFWVSGEGSQVEGPGSRITSPGSWVPLSRYAVLKCSWNIKWDIIISPSLRLLLKVWLWYRCQSRIEKYYYHDGEEITFY